MNIRTYAPRFLQALWDLARLRFAFGRGSSEDALRARIAAMEPAVALLRTAWMTHGTYTDDHGNQVTGPFYVIQGDVDAILIRLAIERSQRFVKDMRNLNVARWLKKR